jgi:hypothetical protein
MASGDVLATRLVAPNNKQVDLEVVTGGRRRLNVRAEEPAIDMRPIVATPDAPGPGQSGAGVFFMRDRGDGKAQYCVRFPSGAVQVLATEP